jgi:hypothetical protein
MGEHLIPFPNATFLGYLIETDRRNINGLSLYNYPFKLSRNFIRTSQTMSPNAGI